MFAAILILPTAWFRDKVRARIVSETERITGGEVEIGTFRFNWTVLTAEVTQFVLRGKEPAGEAPLFQADNLHVGLKIISLLRRDIDIALLRVDRPRINLLVDKSGRTNLPEPRIKRETGKHPLERLVELAISRIELRDGLFHYDEQQIPFNLRGNGLSAQLTYDVGKPSYRGTVSMSRLDMESPNILPLSVALEGEVSLDRARLVVERSRIVAGRSVLQATGAVEDFRAPSVHFQLRLDGHVADLARPLRLPLAETGTVGFSGELQYSRSSGLRIQGIGKGSRLALNQPGIRLTNLNLDTQVSLDKRDVFLRDLKLVLLGGSFRGSAELRNFREYRVKGTFNGLSTEALGGIRNANMPAWSGRVSGPVEVAGTLNRKARDLRAKARLQITPSPGNLPVGGSVELSYDERAGTLRLADSTITTASTTARLNGTLGDRIQIEMRSTNADDLLPVLALFSPNAPKQLPVKLLPSGSATFRGAATGALTAPSITGTLAVNRFRVGAWAFDRLSTEMAATAESIKFTELSVHKNGTRLSGAFALGLSNWKPAPDAPLSGNAKVQGADLARLLHEAGYKLPVSGTLSSSIVLDGTMNRPRASMDLVIAQLSAYGEQFTVAQAKLRYADDNVRLLEGQLRSGPAQVLFTGSYQHSRSAWNEGQARFEVSTKSYPLERVSALSDWRSGISGQIDVRASGQAALRNSLPLLTSLDGQATVRDLVVDGRALGDLSVDARTAGTQLTAGISGTLRGSEIRGGGAFQMTGDYPGSGSLEFAPIAFSTLHDLALASSGAARLPFDGKASGKVTFSGPLRRPDLMQGSLTMASFEVAPLAPLGPPQAAGKPIDLVLRNEGVIAIDWDAKGLHFRKARFTGLDTNLELAGSVSYRERNPWDLKVNGNLDLALLQTLRPDLLASGKATIQAGVRGTLQDPQPAGRVEFTDAAFSLADFPNGIDKANGVILLDRNRATFERFNAQTGGGTVNLAGFVGFGAGEFTYRLQSRAEQVRVRYPEGVSTTVSAVLSLTGTSERSLLSGVVTVRRAGFNPRTDIGGLLAASAKPIATPTTPNEFLRGMNFDVRLETVPNLQFQTSLTTDLQAEADLRLRGTAVKPVLLGRISVNQGEIQFFGNKYTINRGQIGFFNPVKIEPVLDMDLETRVRAVQVNITFAGTINKLDVSYRSDPPLQSTEIIALLAVGRTPGSTLGLASGQTVQSGSFLSGSSNNLLGQAVAAPLSSRLQRFFGISRLKIDPQISGFSAVPQARLTLEQQISKDITLTYITNLSQANQQIVRVQWDLSREWSLVALREENGVFGLDFLFKKRLR